MEWFLETIVASIQDKKGTQMNGKASAWGPSVFGTPVLWSWVQAHVWVLQSSSYKHQIWVCCLQLKS